MANQTLSTQSSNKSRSHFWDRENILLATLAVLVAVALVWSLLSLSPPQGRFNPGAYNPTPTEDEASEYH